jgi:dTDP-glucose pyrophosphorylase
LHNNTLNKTFAIFPTGGFGQRFKNDKILDPKPFIKIYSRPQIEWAILAAKYNYPECQIVIGSRSGIYKNFLEMKRKIETDIREEITIFDIGEKTSGAAHTLTIILERMLLQINDFQFVSLDNDVAPLISKINLSIASDVHLLTTYSENESHSYIEKDKNGKVINIVEKEKISNQGIIGNYFFKSANVFLEENHRVKWNLSEHYISKVIEQYLLDGFKVTATNCNKVISFGTPIEISKLDYKSEKLLSSLTYKNA